MSELMNASAERKGFRRQLLVTVSTLALLTFACRVQAADSDTDRPSLWIELGGQLEAISGQGDPFTAPFMTKYADSPAFKPISPLDAEKAPKFGIGAEGKISFEPADTNWVFSAAMRYGRANGNKQVHEQTPGIKLPTTSFLYKCDGCVHTYAIDKFAETSAQSRESHAIVDFQVGKDAGLGMFGNGGTSVVNLGVRFVQFTSGSSVRIHARPDLTFPAVYNKYFHNYTFSAQQSRSFRGVGPALSWNASVPVAGNSRDGDITFDWGANASVLFGRQKASVQHQTTGREFVSNKYGYKSLYHHPLSAHIRDRSVTVPNLGGFASVSYRFADAALTLGYRGDFFFGAVDGGIDTAKRTTLGFHGPFATISVGLGG
jgi:iron complex outermembrane receptor protein